MPEQNNNQQQNGDGKSWAQWKRELSDIMPKNSTRRVPELARPCLPATPASPSEALDGAGHFSASR